MKMIEPGKRARWRSLLLQIHLHGGLLSCWHLMPYAYTSLGFNHRWMLPDTGTALPK